MSGFFIVVVVVVFSYVIFFVCGSSKRDLSPKHFAGFHNVMWLFLFLESLTNLRSPAIAEKATDPDR